MQDFAPRVIVTGEWLEPPQVQIATNYGDIQIQLDPTHAPLTVSNWLQYAHSGFFDGLIFHRVIDGFMIQGGGLDDSNTALATASPIALESNTGLLNTRGSIAMARTGDPDSATSQFFINSEDNGFLDYSGDLNLGYAVFGQVTQGLTVVDAISSVTTNNSDVPTTPVLIESVTSLNAGAVRTLPSGISLPSMGDSEWSYSVNGGLDWTLGSGDHLVLTAGQYDAGQVQIRLDANPDVRTPLPALDVVSTAPSVTISSEDAELIWSDDTALIRFTLSDVSTDFDASDITVLGGALSNFQGSGRSYTANVVANPTLDRDIVVKVNSGAFSDSTGRFNLSDGSGLDAITLQAHNIGPVSTAAEVMPATFDVPTSAPLLIPNGEWVSKPAITISAQGEAISYELLPEAAPLATVNWLAYQMAGVYTEGYLGPFNSITNPSTTASFYFGTTAGAFNADGNYQTPLFAPVPLEFGNGLSNLTGTLALRPISASAATNVFFANWNDNANWLDSSSATNPGFTVFGQLTSNATALTALSQSNLTANDFPTPSIRIDTHIDNPGAVRALGGEVVLGGTDANSRWSYSLDAGTTWQTGQGTTLQLPMGIYMPAQVQLRLLDASGAATDAITSQLTSKVVAGVNAHTWTSNDLIPTQLLTQSMGAVLEAAVSPNDLNAISLSDVLSALKIYLGKPTGAAIPAALQASAADLDGNGQVDLADVLNLLKVYLGKPVAPSSQPSWTFVNVESVSPDGAISNDGQLINKNYTHLPDIDWTHGTEAPIELIGVLRGDVDGSWAQTQS